jgi:hypothetical protein
VSTSCFCLRLSRHRFGEGLDGNSRRRSTGLVKDKKLLAMLILATVTLMDGLLLDPVRPHHILSG